MSLRLFNRGVKVTCWREAIPTDVTEFVVRPLKPGEQVEIKDLRVQFHVRKDLGKHPNTCDVTITNLAASSRVDLETKPLQVQLEAGYDNVYRFLFAGDLRFGMTKMDGPNWHTMLQLGDGDCHFRWSRMNKSYGSNTTVRKVLTDAATSMGMPLPKNLATDPALDKVIPGSVTAFGATKDVLTTHLAPFGYSWSIQNGQLRILRDDRTHSDTYKEINEENGMIGSPEFGSPPKSGKPPHMTVSMLLYPELMPGDKVLLTSKVKSGFFKVQRVEHRGDTHGDEWKTEIEIKPIDDKSNSKKRP